MQKELEQVKCLLRDVVSTEKDGKVFYSGSVGGKQVVLHSTGIGKVNAALGATYMIRLFHPDLVVSTGCAGGLGSDMAVEDVVVSSELCYHDVWCGPENSLGQVMGLPERWKVNPRLLDKVDALPGGRRIHKGLIVTGDWFVDTCEKAQSIAGSFPDALAVDMESAAIAHACFLQGQLPFVSFRVISDMPLQPGSAQQYLDFWDRMADESFLITKSFIENI